SPLADVVTGGTWFAPESLSFTSAPNAVPLPKVTIETIAAANIDFLIRFMNFSWKGKWKCRPLSENRARNGS
ncbi:MAG TPA: hypothetical protein VES91_09370, partial [Burkholderiaceae bacterium]|nr:hypothetical protein [Burkholderiaceae bacterium]